MSEAAANNVADRRRDARRPIERAAELILREGETGFACAVLDESSGGIQVETAQTLILPEQLLIKFGDTTQLVRRCWSAGNRAGYQFIEIVPVQRRWAQDAPAPEPVDLTALKDFVQLSLTLLDLSTEPGHGVHPAEQINALLSDIPHARLQLQDSTVTGAKVLQLFAIPQAIQGKIAGGQNLMLAAAKDF